MLRLRAPFVPALPTLPALAMLIMAGIAPIAAHAGPQGTVRVIDADTWDVGGQRVRLFGIDAPELDQTCTDADGRDFACGHWAAGQARERFQGRMARCEALDRDRYGRIVARCWVDGRDTGREMVAEGIALAYRKYSMDYDLDEKGAAVNARGLHAGKVQSPADFRRAQAARQAPVQVPPSGCVIKGNISSKGKRIYHLPGQRDYDATRINTRKGERWFCSEQEARAAGWRRAAR